MGAYAAATHSLEQLRLMVESFLPGTDYRHDYHMLVAVREALAAAAEGNFGVGACLVDGNGQVVERGHNHVFHPYVRTDLHAEMDILTRFENRCRQSHSLRDFTLFTSLEPCPMCLTRLITAGVGEVYYASPDVDGGMVCRLKQLTPVWLELAERQKFAEADISPELKLVAHELFLVTANSSHARLLGG